MGVNFLFHLLCPFVVRPGHLVLKGDVVELLLRRAALTVEFLVSLKILLRHCQLGLSLGQSRQSLGFFGVDLIAVDVDEQLSFLHFVTDADIYF